MPVPLVVVFYPVAAEYRVHGHSVVAEAVGDEGASLYVGEDLFPDFVEGQRVFHVEVGDPVYLHRLFLKVKDALRRPDEVFAGSYDPPPLDGAYPHLADGILAVVGSLEVDRRECEFVALRQVLLDVNYHWQLPLLIS